MKSLRYPLAVISVVIGAGAFAASHEAPKTPASAAPAAAPAAPQTPPTRVRGKVEKLDNTVLKVKTREGGTAEIKLPDNFGVIGVTKAKLTDIKPDKFVGIAAKTQKDGTMQALEVVIFPDNMKGFGEGHYPWDLQPESTMTNATVTNAVKNVKGQVLTLKYKDGEKQITVPKNAPIVTFVPAQMGDIKPGAGVFVNATKQADGSLTAPRVAVGLKGTVPPM
jgi:hypothetical protein